MAHVAPAGAARSFGLEHAVRADTRRVGRFDKFRTHLDAADSAEKAAPEPPDGPVRERGPAPNRDRLDPTPAEPRRDPSGPPDRDAVSEPPPAERGDDDTGSAGPDVRLAGEPTGATTAVQTAVLMVALAGVTPSAIAEGGTTAAQPNGIAVSASGSAAPVPSETATPVASTPPTPSPTENPVVLAGPTAPTPDPGPAEAKTSPKEVDKIIAPKTDDGVRPAPRSTGGVEVPADVDNRQKSPARDGSADQQSSPGDDTTRRRGLATDARHAVVEERIRSGSADDGVKGRPADPSTGGDAPARGPSTNARSSETNPGIQAGRNSTEFVRDANPATAATTGSTGVSGGSGDGLAAALGRFLITTAASQDGGNAATSAGLPGLPSATKTPDGAPGQSSSNTLLQVSATRGDAVDGVDNAARLLAVREGSGRYEATLQLEPPELGHLRLRIQMQHHAVSLRVEADNALAGRLIESRFGELRDALAVHGIRVDRAEVVIRGEPVGDPGSEQSQHDEGQKAGRENRHGNPTQGSTDSDADRSGQRGSADTGAQSGRDDGVAEHEIGTGSSETSHDEANTRTTSTAEPSVDLLA